MENANKITINGVEYVQADSISNSYTKNEEGLEYVVVRTYSAGVHFGYLKSRDGKEVVLVQARRAWYWEGAFTLSQLAMEGVKKPENCKFSVVVDEILLTEAIEIIKCTDSAKQILQSVPNHDYKN